MVLNIMQEFKHLVYDGRLEEFDQPVKPVPSWWTAVPDCPSTIDPNVTVEDIVKAIERSAEISRQQYLKYKEAIGLTPPNDCGTVGD